MGPAGSIKSDQEIIPRRVRLPATEPRQLPSHDDVVLPQQFTSFPVTHLSCLLCRVDDIGEMNCCQSSIRLGIGRIPVRNSSISSSSASTVPSDKVAEIVRASL
jgi:hypothetical protein